METLSIVARPGSHHQETHQNALARGAAACGVTPVLCASSDHVRTKHAACWGWRAGQRLRERGHEVLVLERGYMGDRFAWTSLAWNGLNGYGQVPPPPHDGGERFDRHFGHLLRAWKPDGDYVLIAGQLPGDASLRGRDLMPWYREQVATHSGLPVLFRPHPEALARGIRQHVEGAATSCGPLDQALADASLVVTFNSNTGVDALMAGKPATVADSGSMAWGVADGRTVEPDRLAWAHRLAWRQWTLEELRDGTALNVVAGDLMQEMAA